MKFIFDNWKMAIVGLGVLALFAIVAVFIVSAIRLVTSASSLQIQHPGNRSDASQVCKGSQADQSEFSENIGATLSQGQHAATLHGRRWNHAWLRGQVAGISKKQVEATGTPTTAGSVGRNQTRGVVSRRYPDRRNVAKMVSPCGVERSPVKPVRVQSWRPTSRRNPTGRK